MQFYIVHPDPRTSSRLLPDYAIKKVNLREGWQILSDIGHIFEIAWEGQNKLYSASHALTRSFCSSPESFEEFVINYDCNLIEYRTRFETPSSWESRFQSPGCQAALPRITRALPRDRYQHVREYLLTCKARHLSTDEEKRLFS